MRLSFSKEGVGAAVWTIPPAERIGERCKIIAFDISIGPYKGKLVNFESDEFHIRVAKTLQGACQLAKTSFDYFTEMDGVQNLQKAQLTILYSSVKTTFRFRRL